MRCNGWALLALLALVACDDSTSSGKTGGMDAAPEDQGPQGGEGGMGGAGGAGGMGGGVIDGRELRLVGDRDVLVFVGQTTAIEVLLVGGADATPVAGVNLEAALLTEAGQPANEVDGTALRARRGSTGANGIASFDVIAGDTPTTLILELSGGGASPVRVNITVGTADQGALAVEVTYNPEGGRYTYADLQEVRVDLFLAEEVDCELLRASASNPRGAWLSLSSISPFNEVDNSTTAPDLSDGQIFHVMATGISAGGQTLTFGCTPDVAIAGGGLNEASVAMSDLPLAFKGRFPATSRFDLTGLLESSGDETLGRVAEVLRIIRVLGNGNGNRGEELARLFCDVVEFDEGICTVIDGLAGPLVDGIFEMVVPQLVLDLLTALSDLVGIFSEMTIIGEIEFISSYPDDAGNLAGNDNRWQKFRFTWEGEDREFTFGDLGRDYRPVAGAFDARVVGETLEIGTHGMTLKLGIIALGIVELWIAPSFLREPPPVRLEDVLAAVIPCAAINDYIGQPGSGLCEEVLVAALAELLVEQLASLDLAPDAFRLEGSAQLRDSDGDLNIDRLEAGVWNGTIELDGRAFNFPGCFTACRDEACADPECTLE